MRKYLTIWVGEVASTVGSALTSFALGVWILEKTDSVSLFSLNLLLYAVCGLLVMPFAGVAADRWDRKTVIILGDAGAGLNSLVVFWLATSNQLEIWHVYILTGIGSALGMFQWPAYKAMIPMLVPAKQLGRASALSQVGDALAELLGPTIAGALYVMSGIGLRGILFIDFGTFLLATAILIFMPIPRHIPAIPDSKTHHSVIDDLRAGWQYIAQYPGLLGLLVYFVIFNFFLELIYPLALPLIFRIAEPDAAGQAMSKMAAGMFVGIAIMGIWGGPKRRIHAILIPGILSGLSIALAGLRPSLTLITVGGFGYYALLPIIQGADEALWQSKVVPHMQGRVLAIRSAISYSVRPVTLLLAGPLADHVFEPLMSESGALAGSVGEIFGVGPGRGVGLLITVLGLLSSVAAFTVYLHPQVRNVEEEMPDALILEGKIL
ncbi:MAG TPA: MFS transporter [Aggregatilineaceae bacterium]|nr:MFS transporter [Aggregatilineaceae bacterium]